MNKSAIRNFAIWARVQLIEAAKQRAYEYEITEKGENKANLDAVAGRLLTSDEKQQRQQLIEQIRRKGYAQVMEEAAYTWFNRFIALRFMEVNGFLPSKVRLFTDENGAFKPEIMKEAMTVEIDGLDRAKVLDLLDKQNNEELYKYLLITQCNALNQGLPCMFEKISNWTELLFPANLLRPDSVVGQMVSEIPEEDWQDAVQIIGWMYQYYNTDSKGEIDRVQGVVKIRKEQIPAATQIFTPDWIVRYMVENSLGRLWYEGHPCFDKSEWKYYLDEAPQEPEVELQLKKIRGDYASINPEDIKVIDPCMGSGHILVYAFDVLLQIYTSCGWSERDAAKSIIENNLYGLDIDDRAGQLAYFAVMMKARKHNRRILSGAVTSNILAIQDSGFMTDDFIAYVAQKDHHMKADLTLLRSSLKNAKEYGSLIDMAKLNFTALYQRIDIISRNFAEDMFQISYQNTAAQQLLPLIKQAEIMAQKYDVVVTNPPYMGARLINDSLREFLRDNYDIGKTDTYAAFIIRSLTMKKPSGFVGLMTPNTWLTINSYKKLRESLVDRRNICSMLLLSSDAFDEAGVVITAFVLNDHRNHALFYDLKGLDEASITLNFAKYQANRAHSRQTGRFAQLPNTIIDPSFSDRMIDLISTSKNVYSLISSDGQTKTGDNDKYLRAIWEVADSRVGLGKRWCIHAKGGGYRKWYGNLENVIDWSSEARAFYRSDRVARITPEYLWYKEGITWSLISGQNNSFRLLPEGMTFNCAAPTVFTSDKGKEYYVLALLNTSFAQMLLRKYNATINLTIDDIGSIPLIFSAEKQGDVQRITSDCISLSAQDWDSFETSWDFKKHPLV